MEQILELTSFGAKLRVKDGLLEVTVPDLSGAGNHRIESFAPHQVQTILLHRHTSVSSDALLLALQNQVDVFVLNHHDFPEALVTGLTAPPSILLWQQQLAVQGTAAGLAFARHWLCQKVKRKAEWLTKLKSYRDVEAGRLIDQTVLYLRELYVRLQHLDLTDARRLNDKTGSSFSGLLRNEDKQRSVSEAAELMRGMEGAGSRQYLDTLARLLPESMRFEGRSRRPAQDIFNIMLNYGYGILYRWVEKALWESGLNPYIGFHHSSGRNHKGLLFDFIEPFRPWVDKAVFNLCTRKEVNRQHVSELQEGGLWLNRAGKNLVAEAVYERFERKKRTYDNCQWNLRQSIAQEARLLVRQLRQFLVTGALPDWEQTLEMQE